MARSKRIEITAAFLKSIRPTGGYQEFSDIRMAGFGVKVTPSGSIAYTYRWRSPDGKQPRKVIARFPQDTPAQAREHARAFAQTVDHQSDTDTRRAERKALRLAAQKTAGMPTVRRYLADRYTPHLVIKSDNWARTVYIIEQGFADLLDTPLDEVTPGYFETWLAAALKTVSKSTLNRKMTALRGLFSHAIEKGVLTSEHPMNGFKKFREPKGIERYLTHTEELALRAALDARETTLRREREQMTASDLRSRHLAPRTATYMDFVKPVVLLASLTGLRRGELLQLQWHAIDLDNRLIKVMPDTSKSDELRYVPMVQEVHDILTHWKAQSRNTHSMAYVFANALGNPFREIRAWPTVRKEAKLDGFRWHDMRHTFASHLVQEGVGLYAVSKLLGHTDTRMTQRYAHLCPEYMIEAMAKLEKRKARMADSHVGKVASVAPAANAGTAADAA